MSNYALTTTIVHAERREEIEFGAVHRPIHTAAQYAFDDVNDLIAVFQGSGFSYSRQGTPTTASLENMVTLLEEGKATVTFGSGMAALTAIFYTLLRAGDHLICSQFIFGNTNSLLTNLSNLGVEVSFVDPRDKANVEQAIKPNTRMVFTETIANPGTQLADLAGIGQVCQAHHLVYVVDATLCSPYLLKGKDIGASFVMHSLSKYLCGHANALGGSVTNTGLYDFADYPNIYPDYKKGDSHTWGLLQVRKKGLRDMGASLSSDAASRIMNGAETLSLRMQRICDNAMALAQFLEKHPAVNRVAYPGLESHPDHGTAKALFKGKGYGGLLAFELSDEVDCIDFLNHLDIVILATHLGDTRTLALPVAKTIYHEMGPVRRQEMGIAEGLIRVSVGIEDAQDLIGDFEQALNKCLKA